MSIFKKVFERQLTVEADVNAGDVASGVEDSETSDRQAFNGSLDSSTDPAIFDDVEENPAIAIKKQQAAADVSTLQSWIEQIGGFVSYLNGLDPTSINFILSKADCDTVLADVRRSETKKISRIAQDLSGLHEALKQYLLATVSDNN